MYKRVGLYLVGPIDHGNERGRLRLTLVPHQHRHASYSFPHTVSATFGV